MKVLATALIAAAASAAVVDRVAIVVGNTVITESELLEELKLTEFLNGQPLDLSRQARRDAGERLVDQQLIREEMNIGNYPQPSDADVDAMLRKFRQERFGSVAEYHAALEKYGLSESDLKSHLRWQLAAIRFTDIRFRPAIPSSAAEPNSANRAGSDTDSAAAPTVDSQMEAWLKQARTRTKVQFKPEAFQ